MVCPRCGCERLPAAAVAAQANALRAAIEAAVVLDAADPGGALAEAYGGSTRRVLHSALARAADLALAHVRSTACLAGTCALKAANEEMAGKARTDTFDADRQFVVLLWRDEKIQAQKIAEPEIAVRYEGYEFLRNVLQYVREAEPGDSIAVRAERILRVR